MRLATVIFILVPLFEVLILIEVGGIIGALPTISLVVLTAVCGVWLLKHEGIATLARVQDKLNRGEVPETELLEGVMLIIGGALLLTPGFVTDFAGFVCLLPGLRRPLAARIVRSTGFNSFQMGGRFTTEGHFTGRYQQHTSSKGQTIDGQFESEPVEPADQIDRRKD